LDFDRRRGFLFIAGGYANFSSIAYHFAKAEVMPATWIPIAYAIAMAVDGVGALGWDRFLTGLASGPWVQELIIDLVIALLLRRARH
jgi:hypothetical protein